MNKTPIYLRTRWHKKQTKQSNPRIPEQVITFALPVMGGLGILWDSVKGWWGFGTDSGYKDSVVEGFEVGSKVSQDESKDVAANTDS